MRFLVLVAAAAAACSATRAPDGEGMPESVTVKARGLYTQPSEAGGVPDGALAQADNVIVSRDNQIETRRGMEIVSARALTKIFPWKGVFLGHDGGSVLSRSDANGATWTDYPASIAPPAGERARFAVANGNAYFTTAAGPFRLDALTGTPERHGMPDALDAQASLLGVGSALGTNAQAGYRVLFGKIDANGNTILGAPSSRAVVVNAAGTTQDIGVTYALPQGLPSGAFVQGYRTPASVSSTTDPGDEEGLVYQGAVPLPQALTTLARAASTVTATTAQAHGYAAGMTVRVPTTVQVAAVVAAVGVPAETSPDGITWTSRTIPAGTWQGVAWNGTNFAAVGLTTIAASSPDGVTWTGRTIPTGDYRAVTWNGSVFVAVGINVAATSPDGVTWTARAIPAGSYRGVAWNGSIFAAVGNTVAATSPDGTTWTARTVSGSLYAVAWNGSAFAAVGQSGASATSPDGVTWTARVIGAFPTLNAVAWSGSTFAAVGSSAAATSPDGVTWTSRTIAAGIYNAVLWNGTALIAVGSSAATSPDGVTWTAQTQAAGTFFALAASGAQFPSGEKVIAATPTTTTFTYAEAGGTGSVATAQTVTPLTGAFTDQVPSGFLGATIYTAPGQNGIAGSASQILGARDVAVFRETLFLANITYPSSVDLYMLAVGGSAGIVNGDTITIDGLTYTAGASESISGRQFKITYTGPTYSTGSPSSDIINTSASLLRVLNRTLGNTVTARDVSDPNGVPGHLFLQESNGSTTCTVTFSRASSWAIGAQRAPSQQKNELRWSQLQQPDVTPALNSKRIGSADSAILRIVPTRSALFILKEDGAWILSGYSAPWQIDPFDPTIQLLGPETAVVLDNQVYGLTHHGVVRISDTGASLVSRPIEDLINAALTKDMQAVTAPLAFGVADGHDHKFYLWLPSASSDTQPTQAYVFDTYTDAWFRRTDAAVGGVQNPTDDRIYLATAAGVKQERKTFTAIDLADESYPLTVDSGTGSSTLVLADASAVRAGDAIGSTTTYAIVLAIAGNVVTLDRAADIATGATLGYRAISTAVEWTPRFGGGPGVVNHFQEVSLVFRRLYFAAASLGFASSLNAAWTDLSLAGSDYGFTGAAVPRFALRSLVDLEHARAPQLSVRWQHAQAFSPAEIEACSIVFRPLSVRLGR